MTTAVSVSEQAAPVGGDVGREATAEAEVGRPRRRPLHATRGRQTSMRAHFAEYTVSACVWCGVRKHVELCRFRTIFFLKFVCLRRKPAAFSAVRPP